MKKIMLLPLLAFLFSCSTDDSAVNWQNDGVALSVYSSEREALTTSAETTACFTFTASASVDVSNGFGNPIVVFKAILPGSVSSTAKFKIKVEVQPLSNCNDMNSDTGVVQTFAGTSSVQNVVASPPTISVLPSQLPICYKWRFVMEGISDAKKYAICYSATEWYESPLF